MDRNTITGLILIGLILITSTFLFRSTEEDIKKDPVTATAPATTDTYSAAQPTFTDTANATLTPTNPLLPGFWAPFSTGENKITTLENEDVKVQVSAKGGRITFVELKKYKTYDGSPLILVSEESSRYNITFPIGSGQTINTQDLYFTPEQVTPRSVTMAINLPEGRSIRQTYTLENTGFMVQNQLRMQGLDRIIPRRDTYLDLSWENRVKKIEKDSTIAAQNTTIHYRIKDDGTDYLSETSDDNEKFKDQTEWVSFKQQFFCQALISVEQPFINADISTKTSTDPQYLKDLSAQLTLPFKHQADQAYNMQFFFGPLHYNTLRAYKLDLERQIPLGWSFFLISWVNRFLVIPVFHFLSQFISNYGIIIFILTIIIKLLVMPLTYKSYLSTAKMRILKPELDELKEKHGGDLAKMQQEQMKIYRKAGVSPFGGCMPLLLQTPILIAMFRFFPSSIELRQQGFLWAEDLSVYDSIYNLPFNIPFYGDHVSLFTLLMTVSTILYTRLNNSITPQQAELKWMSYLMPIFFLGFFNNYAAGLSLYYFLFNILTFGQQYLFKLFIDEKKLKNKIEENKKRPVTKSKIQQKLEDMAKRQQQLQSQKKQTPPKPRRR